MIILVAFLILAAYTLGSAAGELKAMAVAHSRLKKVMVAVKKVTELAELRGENLAQLSESELLSRIEKQLGVQDE